MRGFSERWAPSRRSCDTMSGMANHEKRRQEDAKKKAKSNTRAKSGAGSKNAGRSRAARRAGASDSPCPVDARCGGCKNLCVPYTKQLIDKQLRIERLFAPLAPVPTSRAASATTTLALYRVSSRATAQPTAPPPMMQKSYIRILYYIRTEISIVLTLYVSEPPNALAFAHERRTSQKTAACLSTRRSSSFIDSGRYQFFALRFLKRTR